MRHRAYAFFCCALLPPPLLPLLLLLLGFLTTVQFGLMWPFCPQLWQVRRSGLEQFHALWPACPQREHSL